MKTTTATLAGVNLTNASSVGWDFTPGTVAHRRVFTVHKRDAEELREQLGKPVTLKIKPANGEDLVVNNLFILRERPQPTPFLCAFEVADTRWQWPYVLYYRAANMVRRTGSRRLVGGRPVEIAQTLDGYHFAQWAMYVDGKRWEAKYFLNDVLDRVITESKYDLDYAIDSLPRQDEPTNIPLQNIEICEAGDAAIRRALALFGGAAEIKIDKDGKAHVYNAMDLDAAKDQMKALGPPTVLGNIPIVTNLKAIRPERIKVYFEREIEVRFDSVEEGDSGYAFRSDIPPPDVDSIFQMHNVIQLPDPETTIDGEVYAQGSWVPVDKALQAWNADLSSLEGGSKFPLTLANVRRLWFMLESIYVPLGNLTAPADQANWAARIMALKTHFRRTYRLPTEFMQRARDLKGWRVGILDPLTGQRNVGNVWGDYCIVPTAKYRVVHRKDKGKQAYWLNVEGYPGIDEDLESKDASPAQVEILDTHLGIVRVAYNADHYEMHQNIIPSVMKGFDQNGSETSSVCPIRDLSRKDVSFSTRWRVSNGVPIGLAARHRVAIVLTAIQGAPNSKHKFYCVTVKPEHVKDRLKKDFKLEGGEGPDLELFVPSTTMTAWHALSSTRSGRAGAKTAFGLDGKGALANLYVPNDLPGYSTTNEYYLDEIARTLAVVTWAAYVDQVEGSKAGKLTPSADNVGNADLVAHLLSPNGQLSTTIRAGQASRPLDWQALLPEWARHLVLGQIKDHLP